MLTREGKEPHVRKEKEKHDLRIEGPDANIDKCLGYGEG